MIPANAADEYRPAWHRAQAGACRSLGQLLDHLRLDPADLPEACDPDPEFPLRVPWPFVARMRPGDPNDPLLRQVLPLRRELDPVPGFVADPVGDGAAQVAPGLLHKYHGRALLTITGACGVHCRYCFRRHYPYGETGGGTVPSASALAYLKAHDDIEEIILSGGDPLTLSDARLARTVRQLEAIPHLRRLRLHSRQPVVLPPRITPELVALLRDTRLHAVMVLHINHANEIDDDLGRALAPLRAAGIPLYNQAVLLAGVNDSVRALEALSLALFETGIQPLYLHLLDRVAGAAHFEVPEPRAIELVEALRARLPGYLMPRLVRETPGASAKHPRA